jgi:leucine dehydrogenase
MNPTAPYAKTSHLTTPLGEIHVRSFCSPEEIRRYHFDDEFGIHAQFKSLYTRRESLEADAVHPEANVTLALNAADHIIGFAVLAYPEIGERWRDLGPGLMMELRVIEVCRSWRSGKLAYELLKMAMDHPHIEDKIAYMVGYAWTWDLDGTTRRAQEYRQILIRLFESQGFSEYETNEPNICLKQENLFMCRVGRRVPDEVVERFNWLRFGIAPEPEPLAAAVGRREMDRQSLFVPLKAEGLTFLGIYFNWRNGLLTLRAAEEWDALVDWEAYNRLFTTDVPLMSDIRCLGHAQVLGLFDRYGMRSYLEKVLNRLKAGRHLGLECYLEPRRGIQVLNFMHSNPLERGHRYRARRAGGLCCFGPEADETRIVAEGLNTSRATSFKNAVAQMPFGGCRISIQTSGLESSDRASLGFIAYILDRVHAVVGPDLGFPLEVADVIRREGYSTHLVGGPEDLVGPPGRPTAYGVYLALKEAAYIKYGSVSLAGRRIVVQGAGAVGADLVRHYLASEGAQVYVADIKAQAVARLRSAVGPQLNVIDADAVMAFDGDILVPCAVGSMLDADTIGQLKYTVVLGAANNTLRAENPEQEIELAALLAHRGILYQVDWMHNNAGLIAVAESYLHPQEASLERVLRQVEEVCRNGVRENFIAARASGITPTEQAYRRYNSVVYN